MITQNTTPATSSPTWRGALFISMLLASVGAGLLGSVASMAVPPMVSTISDCLETVAGRVAAGNYPRIASPSLTSHADSEAYLRRLVHRYGA